MDTKHVERLFAKMIRTRYISRTLGLTPQQVANIRQNLERDALTLERKITLLEKVGYTFTLTVTTHVHITH